jgi:hypothetical protein
MRGRSSGSMVPLSIHRKTLWRTPLLLWLAWSIHGASLGRAQNQIPNLPASASAKVTAVEKLGAGSFVAVYSDTKGVHAILYEGKRWSRPLTLSDSSDFISASSERIVAEPSGRVSVFWRQRSSSAERLTHLGTKQARVSRGG